MDYKETIEIASGDGWTINEIIPSRVTEAREAAKHFEKVIGEDMDKQEIFSVMALDGASNIIYCKAIHKGTLNQSLVHPREVFSDAILHRAAGIIIAHNHPSNTNEPSRADIQITQRLKEGGKILGIELLDHIILTPSGDIYSFQEEGDL